MRCRRSDRCMGTAHRPVRLGGGRLIGVLAAGLGMAACGAGTGGGAGGASEDTIGGSGAGTTTTVEVTVSSVSCDGTLHTSVTTSTGVAGRVQTSTATVGGFATATVVTPVAPGGIVATPAATPPVLRANPVVLRDADGGTSMVVHAGTRLTVILGPSSAPFCWSAPSSSDGAVLRLVSSSAANDRTAHASFVAGRTGSAEIQASDGPRCIPACGAADELWSVSVTVIP